MQSDFSFPQPGTRVLLLNCHAYDIRLPWWRWHQPTGLLQLGAALQSRECDVRFIDCVAENNGSRITREKYKTIKVENYDLDLWRFGARWPQINNQIRKLVHDAWTPDCVYISCFQTTWWQAARDLVQRVRKWFPNAEVTLGGIYPTLAPNHAALHSTADYVVSGPIAEAREHIPDLRLYLPHNIPRSTGIYLYSSQSVTLASEEVNVQPRDPVDVVSEIIQKAELGVSDFAFFDEEICLDQRLHYIETLQTIAKSGLRVRLTAIGNISPILIDAEIAYWMKEAGYREINLKCDMDYLANGARYSTSYEEYRVCVEALQNEAGFKQRHGDVTAMLVTGYPYEDIEATTERLVKLASIVGAINLVPFQYSPRTQIGDCYSSLVEKHYDEEALELLNCKLYPLARASGNRLEDYMELTRLAALLNSKYRSQTFDFLGEGLIAELLQNSIRTGSWNPLESDAMNLHDVIPLKPIETGEMLNNDHKE